MATSTGNAAPGRFLSARQFATGDALFKGIFGKSAIDILYDGHKKWMVWETQDSEPELPKTMDYYTEGRLDRDFSGNKSTLVDSTVRFAGRFRFVAREARFADIDFLKEIKLISNMLKSASNSFQRRGIYGKSFGYIIGGVVYKDLPPRDADFTVIGVTNVSTYASTLENPTWHRPFNIVWPFAKARAAAMGYDIVFKYISGGSIPYYHKGIRPDPNRKQSYPRWIKYAIPTIQIAPYGSIKVTGKPRARHGKNRRRMT